MTEVVKVTSKGQITLPISIRNQLEINKDSYIAVDIIGDTALDMAEANGQSEVVLLLTE